jgi:predicted nucleic acid-binding protein
MAKPAELAKLLDHKFVVFDTNILIEAYKHFDAFAVLLNFFKRCNCKVLYFPLIQFEFTRDAFIAEHHRSRQRFLEKLGGTSMPFNDELVREALSIANVYAHQKIASKPSLVDCCIAALMKHYADKVFLVTTNHKDFPLLLFDRIHTLLSVLKIRFWHQLFISFLSINGMMLTRSIKKLN